MKFFGKEKTEVRKLKRATPFSVGELRFASIKTLESQLDGSEDRFAEYFFALYHCSPYEASGIRERREELKKQYPTKFVEVGEHFVLVGEPAFQALAAYYRAMAESEVTVESYRKYYAERLNVLIDRHQKSQSLLVQIDLTEGQLSNDEQLEFLTCVAIANGQIVSAEDSTDQ